MEKRVFKPFSVISIHKIEQWLSSQAEKGWRLVSYKNGFFEFRESKPAKREYFVYIYYALDNKKGCEFQADFLFIKKKYALRKSEINKQNDTVIEIDVRRIDEDYKRFRLLRTKYYIKTCSFDAKIFLFSAILMFAILFFKPALIVYLLLLVLIPGVYRAVQVFILKRYKRSLESQ